MSADRPAVRRIDLEGLLEAQRGPREAPAGVSERVAEIIARVRAEGLPALLALRDVLEPEAARAWPGLEVPEPTWSEALAGLEARLRDALAAMKDRVERFARAQREALQDVDVELLPGLRCAQRVRAIDRVGCYVPGGRHPLPSSLVMTAVTARVAGVREVVCVCPNPTPLVRAAARLAGATRLLAMGGAHAVAALAYGVEGLPRVDLIAGPGGVWVSEAKRQVQGQVGIDLPAGPSEVLVLADDTSDPARVIADLEAQAEHDPSARPLLATTSEALADRVEAHVRAGFGGRPNEGALAAAFREGGLIVVCASRRELAGAANAIAPEHLSLHIEDPDALLPAIDHFGAAFSGGHAAEVFGDYGAGPNHVLPTGAAARFTAGLSVHTFLRVQTVTRMTRAAAAALAEPTALLADAEGLDAHARAARLRGGGA